METVSFTAMADGTQEDYALLKKHEDGFVAALPDRLLEALDALRSSLGGYRVTRLEHSLQSATRADRNARDRFRDSPHVDACAEFCEKYDQNCFDPDHDTLPVRHFEPLLRQVFSAPRYLQEGIS